MAKRTKKTFIGICSIIALLVAAWFFLPLSVTHIIPKATASGDEIVVSPRTVIFGVDATGFLRATSMKTYGPPPPFGDYWQFKIVNLVPEGRQVKAGDSLITFDAQKVRDDLQKFQNDLDQAVKELEKTKAQIQLEHEEFLAKLAVAENNYEKLKLKQTGNSPYDAPKKVEEDRLAFEQARREVAAIKDRIEWHQKSSDATVQIIVSKKARAENKVNEIKRGMADFEAKTDRDGVVIHKTKWNGERFQVGEDVWAGFPVLEIPDLNTLIAEAFVPEVDIGKIKIEQHVDLTIDAFPGKTYVGAVKSMGTLVHPKSWDIPNKVLDIQIALAQLDTHIMRPGMSLKTRIQTAALPDCLAVPLKAVRTTTEGSKIKVKTENGWREQKVKLGEANGAEVVILEGLSAGDRIAGDYAKAK
ncbi:MAG: HlyD family efflux transporter periplasmic adaptor subunit [Blastocatellia bacterium]|nr:HlyD family efflux transporter periplasmic adaptor subunit [Blastocatellia bacterium]